jgi:hypothetical protein
MEIVPAAKHIRAIALELRIDSFLASLNPFLFRCAGFFCFDEAMRES